MRKIYYRKLIRDLIPAKMMRQGADFSAYRLAAQAFERELLKKVGEEADGLAAAKNKTELLDELADVLAVIEEIKKLKKISPAAMRAAFRANMRRKGGFRRRVFLIWSEDTGYRSNERRYDGQHKPHGKRKATVRRKGR